GCGARAAVVRAGAAPRAAGGPVGTRRSWSRGRAARAAADGSFDASARAAAAGRHPGSARAAHAAAARPRIGSAAGLPRRLRRERRSIVVRVTVERGRPVHIAASRRGIPHGAVTQAAGPWRTSGEWWAASRGEGTGQRNGAGWDRDEWDVALTSGAVCLIYRD